MPKKTTGKLPAPSKPPACTFMAIVREDGTLFPADNIGRSMCRNARLRIGDKVRVTVTKPRNYQNWKKAHQLGTLIAVHIDEFARYQLASGKFDSHGALKRLQWLSGYECEDTVLELADGQEVTVRVANSLAFDEMDQTRFDAAYAGFCRYLIDRWWGDLEQWQIEEMASLLVE